MINKIISSGINSVERGALDLALKLGISCGGSTPGDKPSRVKELEDRYGLKKTAGLGFKQAVEENVSASDGTLVITRGNRDDRTRHAVKHALQLERQLLHVDLSQYALFEAASLISSWFSMQKVKSVFVTGPGDEKDRTLYSAAQKVLETALYLGFVKSDPLAARAGVSMGISSDKKETYPRTVDQAVEVLTEMLPLKDRAMIANMQSNELDGLASGLGEFIKQKFGLYGENAPLLNSCAERGGLDRPLADEASAVILRALWQVLKNTHKLRIIK